jgi:hypothetical protein
MDDVTLRVRKSLLVIATVILVGGALGLVGFLLGRDSADTGSAERISAEPQAQAQAEGLKQARQAGYDDGFAAGKHAAEPTHTYNQGLIEGRRNGYDRGYAQGGYDALGLARFDFTAGAFYIVQFAGGANGQGLQVSTVNDLLAGRSYEICNTNDLCFR